MRQADIMSLSIRPALTQLQHLFPSHLIFAHKVILPIYDMEILFESIDLCAYESVSHFIYPFWSHDLISAVNISLVHKPV